MAENTPNPPPSTNRADCPEEACLEFIVVDHWGNEISPPTAYDLKDVGPVNPGVPVTCLKKRNYTLRATEGEELREKMKKKLPYEPQGYTASPDSHSNMDKSTRMETAEHRADREGFTHHKPREDALWEPGVRLMAECQDSLTPCRCRKHLIELEPVSLDYAIIMAFLDNHSGGIHGSGHAGILIINGSTGEGTFTDFGPYRKEDVIDKKTGRPKIDKKTGQKKVEELAKVRLDPTAKGLVDPDLRLDENALGKFFVSINQKRGSGIISEKPCRFTSIVVPTPLGLRKVKGLEGPSHPMLGEGVKGFPVNGQVAWAAYALHLGAYGRMLAYAQEQERKMAALTPEDKNGYKLTFNCMTYAIAVLDVGLGYPADMKHGTSGNIDHPNDHIGKYMIHAVEAGFFDDRRAEGWSDANRTTPRGRAIPGIRHHTDIDCVNYTDVKAGGIP